MANATLGREYVDYIVSHNRNNPHRLGLDCLNFLADVVSTRGLANEFVKVVNRYKECPVCERDFLIKEEIYPLMMDVAPTRCFFQDMEGDTVGFASWPFDNEPEKVYDQVYEVWMASFHSVPFRINANSEEQAVHFALAIARDEYPGFFWTADDLAIIGDPTGIFTYDKASGHFLKEQFYPKVRLMQWH